jgi:hypothetical protein
MNAPSERPAPASFPPALPEATGRNDAASAFFREAAGAFEFMALWHSLDAPAQAALRNCIHVAAATSAVRSMKAKP